MRPSRSRIRLLPALLLALVLGGLAGFRGLLAGGQTGSDWTDGDNPVVGSLPCIADPSMDAMFWLALGLSDRNETLLAGQPPVVSVLGNDTEEHILDAWGTPLGRTNGPEGDWNAFGLANEGTVVLARSAITGGEIELWQWVPEGYIGGEWTVSHALGSETHSTASDLFELPLLELSVSPPSVLGVATLTIAPAPGNEALPVLTLRIQVVSGTVVVEFEP